MVAIPCMFAYFFFKGKFTSNVARVSRLLGNHAHHLGMALRCGGIYEESASGQIGNVPESER
jgi:hypothetical protein